MKNTGTLLTLVLAISGILASPAWAAGDAEKGARVYRACAACHSMKPGRHMTGPSLAGIWGKKAASVARFARYSSALKNSGVVWDDATMDAWLANPKKLIPGTLMTFRGISDSTARSDLIAYLKTASEFAGAKSPPRSGMMQSPTTSNLKKLGPENLVAAVTYCGDTYRVTTVAGVMKPFWEFNLRFKTDSSNNGPHKGRPALIRASMMGDRAFVIFADPMEISSLIERKC